MLKNDLFGFPKVKFRHLTGEVDTSFKVLCQIFSGFNIPKIIKIVNFWQSYSKNKQVDVLGTQCILGLIEAATDESFLVES